IPTPSLSWTYMVAEHLDAEYLNRGIGSMIFEAPSLPAEQDCSPDMIFIEYGSNDLGKTPDNETALQLADAWLARLCELYPAAEKYCMPPDFSPRADASDAYWNRMEPYTTGLTELCRRHNIAVIPGKPLIPDLRYLFCDDYTHFNEAGSAIFAGQLLYALRHL
ncbi:MAG: SGNH/GDSL hydrolase family protein, partial [Clostridia bacterium]|nr:SGNH/GDSL hydrolase family protein [Clostridia bacterium]